jgi:hypothetical protein
MAIEISSNLTFARKENSSKNTDIQIDIEPRNTTSLVLNVPQSFIKKSDSVRSRTVNVTETVDPQPRWTYKPQVVTLPKSLCFKLFN